MVQVQFSIRRRTLLLVPCVLAVAAGAAWGGREMWRAHAGHRTVDVPKVEQDFGRQKVVYHLTEDGGRGGAKHTSWLGNMENHYAALAPGALELAVVINGDGIELLIHAKQDPALAVRIDRLKAKGTRFYVCRNTLVGRGLDPETDLYGVTRADLIGAGVAEIALLQREGYAYLKP